MVDKLKEKFKAQTEELHSAQRERNALMAAKRKAPTIFVHLVGPTKTERAELQLPTRKSHFDVQADAAKGYSKSELRRTFRSHVERIELFIHREYG